jgi:tripartite ATP-independent transporter DctM subunit
MSETLALWMFPMLIGLIFIGFPVAFAMMGTTLVFGWLVFGPALVFQLSEKVEDVAGNFVLAAVPLFVFMGAMLERSGIAERLFEAVHLWTRRLPGGLAVGTVLMCVVFAASTGVIGATETIVGMLAIPVMLRYGYDRPLICGTIAAGGSLGTIIPPSVVVVVLGPLANVPVGDLMAGMLFPGLALAGTYILYILGRCILQPSAGPVIPPAPDDPPFARKLFVTAQALAPPLAMIAAVLGSLFAGIAAPTEAAALGALGSVLLSIGYGRFSIRVLHESLMRCLNITAMIMLILLAGNMLTGVFVAAGGVSLTQDLLAALRLDAAGVLLLVLALGFAAGFVLDWVSICLILVPIFAPVLRAAGIEMLWFCILFLIIIQTSYITPPMAPAIFYLRGICPPEITTRHMYFGMLPFLACQVATLAMVWMFPALALWLPAHLMGFN